ncbi:MAG: hypothetical protein B9S36_02495 [Verrucomicrobiia bacterium Tous-C2TDCM]|nr:MAG: hypothetical protein B9S36_02495 [Verrucomicrobiae bacterium Tous-C2TDCM]
MNTNGHGRTGCRPLLKSVSIRVHPWLKWVLLIGLLPVQIASACTIPVFRYALDRWEADPFRLVVPKAWATDRDKVKLLVTLRGNGLANVLVEESGDPALDRAKWLFPHDDAVLSEGGLDADTLAAVLDSPVRRELLQRILQGDSVVWVVATKAGGESEVERIASRLRFLEQVAELPAQNPDDPDSQLGPGPELKLKFSVLPLSLDDAAERHFAAMLAGPRHVDFVKEDIPFAAPVFGRGRVLGAWALEELDDLMIEDTSLFLTGRCSCRVKNENPGWDLLLKVDWETSLASVGVEETIAVKETAAAPSEPKAETSEVVQTVEIAPAAPDPPKQVGLSWLTLGGIGLAVIFALAGWRLWRVR